MAGTEHVCVALDVGSNMGGRRCENPWELDDRATHQDLGLNTLMGLVNKKMMFHPRHVLGLVLFGTEGAPPPSRAVRAARLSACV
eukprot:COSAG01_NODE_2879_length_6922_cov_7.777810_1_plen_85_part_00